MNDGVEWEHSDASGASFRATNSAGNVIGEASVGGSQEAEPAELDHLGVNAGHHAPLTGNPPPDETGVSYPGFGSLSETLGGCRIDGMPIQCDDLQNRRELGTVAEEEWVHDAIGYQGWIPLNREIESRGVGLFMTYTHAGENQRNYHKAFASPQDTAGQKCNERLAGLFGGEGAEVATDKEPDTLGSNANRIRTDGGEDPANGVLHIYANKYGEAVKNGLYTPKGFTGQPYRDWYYRDWRRNPDPSARHPHNPGVVNDELQNIIQVNYRRGSLWSLGFTGDLRIQFIHVGPIDEEGTPLKVRGKPNSADSVYIGIIGGVGDALNTGGQSKGYNHTHIKFYSGNKLTDPRKIFCRDLGFK
jgi:hypothetical protein